VVQVFPITKDIGHFVGKKMKLNPNWQNLLILIPALLVAPILVLLYPDIHHGYDVPAFQEWSHHWAENWRNIYLSCSTCNYPIIGTFSSAGIISFLAQVSKQNTALSFRIFLSIIDGVNIFLILRILRHFSIKNAVAWSSVIGILPASYIGSSLWGQIDGISQTFILASLAWIIIFPARYIGSKKNNLVYIFVASLLLSALALTKQLTVFSLFPLGFILASNLFFNSQGIKGAVINLSMAIIVFLVFTFLWDLFLSLPTSFWSHLQFIWATGSDHGKIISANGFNMWMLFASKATDPSTIPFFANTLSPIISHFSPYKFGILFFLIYNLVLLISLMFFIGKNYQKKQQINNIQINMIFYLALANLSFNVLLTGTHERYLYHFYPLMLLTYLVMKKHNKELHRAYLYLILFGASIYGLFVFTILREIHIVNIHAILGIFHIFLLLNLTSLFLKNQNFKQNLTDFSLFTKKFTRY